MEQWQEPLVVQDAASELGMVVIPWPLGSGWREAGSGSSPASRSSATRAGQTSSATFLVAPSPLQAGSETSGPVPGYQEPLWCSHHAFPVADLLPGFQQNLPGRLGGDWGLLAPMPQGLEEESHAAHGGGPHLCRDDVRPCLLEPAEAAVGGQPAPGAAAGLRRGLRGGDQPPVHPVHEGGGGGPQRGGEQHHRWASGCQPSRALLPRAGPWAHVFHTPLPALFRPRLVLERILHQPQAAPSAAARAPRRREGGLTSARMRSRGRSEPSPRTSRHTSPRARAQPPASPSSTAGEQSALDVKNQIAFQNQADLFSIVRESTFSRDLVFVFFLTVHPPRGPPLPDSAALRHGLGRTSDVSQLPDIFLTAVRAAFVSVTSWLGQARDPVAAAVPAPASLPFITHSTRSRQAQGLRPGCQCHRALHEMNYVIVTF